MSRIHWRLLAAELNGWDEERVKAALDYELAGERRWAIARRLHQRYCTLRSMRERAELKAELGG